jgi:hypothetical protein
VDQLADNRSSRQYLYSARQMIALTDTDSPKKFTLGAVREAGGYTWRGAANIYCHIVADEVTYSVLISLFTLCFILFLFVDSCDGVAVIILCDQVKSSVS